MKEYKALISIPAECEEDFKEQLESLDAYELEWWCECKGNNDNDKVKTTVIKYLKAHTKN